MLSPTLCPPNAIFARRLQADTAISYTTTDDLIIVAAAIGRRLPRSATHMLAKTDFRTSFYQVQIY